MNRSVPLAVLAFLACSLAVPSRAADPLAPEPGSWWEVTSQMTLRGANVPPEVQKKPQTTTSRECLPRKIPDRPPPDTGECKISDYRRSGSKVAFKLACQGGITGETELVLTSSTYSGTTVMRGQGMENRITTKGKPLGGDCDANEQARARAARRAGPGGAKEGAANGGDDAEPAEDAPEADGNR
jgi:hypothetical protein